MCWCGLSCCFFSQRKSRNARNVLDRLSVPACVLILFTTKNTKSTKRIGPAYRACMRADSFYNENHERHETYRAVLIMLKDRKARNRARCASPCNRNAFRRLRTAAERRHLCSHGPACCRQVLTHGTTGAPVNPTSPIRGDTLIRFMHPVPQKTFF